MKIVLSGLRVPHYGPALPLGLLKTYVEADRSLAGEVRVVMKDFTLADDLGRIEQSIAAEKPDLVGFSCYVWNILKIRSLAHRVKRRLPKTRVLLGGPQVGPTAGAVLRENPSVDMVIRDEGEDVFKTLVAVLLGGGRLDDVKGITYRWGGAAEETPPAPLLEDLSVLPSPLLAGLFQGTEPLHYLSVETSRGCPFDCKFCDWGTRQRTRYFPEDRVCEEIEYILKYRLAPFFSLTDADILMDKPRAKSLIRRFLEMARRERFGAMHFNCNLAHLDEELLDLLEGTHRIMISAGVQTVSREVNRNVTRPFQRELVERNIALLKKRAPHVQVNIQLMGGLPGDSLQGLRRSLDWALGLGPAAITYNPLLYLPGSGLARDPDRYGVEWDPAPPFRVVRTRSLSREDMSRCHDLGFGVTRLFVPWGIREVFARLARAGGAGDGLSFVSVYERFLAFCEARGLSISLLKEAALELQGQTARAVPPAIAYHRDVFAGLLDALRDFTASACAELGPADARGTAETVEIFSRETAWMFARFFGLWKRVWRSPVGRGLPARGPVLVVGREGFWDAVEIAQRVRPIHLVNIARNRLYQGNLAVSDGDGIEQSFCGEGDLSAALARLPGPYSAAFLVNAPAFDGPAADGVLDRLVCLLSPTGVLFRTAWPASGEGASAAAAVPGWFELVTSCEGELRDLFHPYHTPPRLELYRLQPSRRTSAGLFRGRTAVRGRIARPTKKEPSLT